MYRPNVRGAVSVLIKCQDGQERKYVLTRKFMDNDTLFTRYVELASHRNVTREEMEEIRRHAVDL